MNLDSQSPLVAAMAAGIVWLSLELRRAQNEVTARVNEMLASYREFTDRIVRVYEARIEEMRQLFLSSVPARERLES